MNKSAHFWIIALVILFTIYLLYSANWHIPHSAVAASMSSESSTKSELETNAATKPPLNISEIQVESRHSTEAISGVEITRIAQPKLITKTSSIVKLRGSGETAILLDTSDKPLLKATPANPIYSLKSAPSGQKIVVSRGDGINELYNLEPFELICQLPLVPNVPRASAIGSWEWIDESTLVGVTDVARPNSELAHLTGAERESAANWREETLLYSFDLEYRKLTKIDTTGSGLPASFMVVETHAGGLIKVEWDEMGEARSTWAMTRRK